MKLPRPTQDYLNHGATRGQRNEKLFAAACQLRDAGLGQAAAEVELLPRALADGLSEGESRSAIASAYQRSARQPIGRGMSSTSFKRPASIIPKKPLKNIDPATRVENWLKGFRADLVDTWEASSIRPPDNWRLDGVCLLEYLYRPDEQLNVVIDYTLDADGKAKPQGRGRTMTRDEWLARLREGPVESEAGAWLRMNPLDGQGIADANVATHRFCLLESDVLPVDLQLSVFARLKLPVAAILTSGGRSFHCWVAVDATDADDYRMQVGKLLSILAPLGIDPKNKNPSRLSRLPGAQRKIGAVDCGKQRILYLNPNPPEGRRILE